MRVRTGDKVRVLRGPLIGKTGVVEDTGSRVIGVTWS